MKKLLTLLFGIMTISAAQSQHYLLTGSYTGEKSKGIYVYRFAKDGSAKLVDSAVTPNPSYLAISPDQQFVFAVNELGNGEGGGQVSAFRFDKQTGKLRFVNQVPAMGEHPCYISVDKTGKWAIVGNYTGGNFAVLPIQQDGSLAPAIITEQHYGKGTTDRQEKPHVHSTVLSNDNKTLYVADLGIDKLMIYSFDAKTGGVVPKDTTLKFPNGSGPRHFEIHPNAKWAYLLQELSGNVTGFKIRDGLLQSVQTVSALPKGFNQPFTSADIHISPDGKFLYASNRDASNTLAIFKINPSTGRLSLVGHQSVLGKTPRNFSFDPSGNFLLTANQNSDEIVVFAVNRVTGKLRDTGKRITTGKPVCLKWIRQ